MLLHTACAPLTKLLDLPSPRRRLLLALFSLLLCCYHGTHLTARSDSAGSQMSDHVAQPPPYKSVLKQKTSRQTSDVCFQLSLNQGSRNSTYEIRQAITVANKLSVAAPQKVRGTKWQQEDNHSLLGTWSVTQNCTGLAWLLVDHRFVHDVSPAFHTRRC